MSSKVRVQLQQRGLTNYKLIFSIAMMECGETQTYGTGIAGIADFLFKFTVNVKSNCTLLLGATFKLHEKMVSKGVPVEILLNFKNSLKQFQCADAWLQCPNLGQVELKKNAVICPTKLSHQVPFLEIDIKFRVITPELIPVYKKLSEDTTFTDFNLRAGDGTMSVHKAMLAVHSDVFLALLNGEWKETAEGIISLNGVTLQTLLHLKEYMYLKTLPGDLQHLQQLLLFAQCYMMHSLFKECITKLVEMVTPENFDTLVDFACQNNVPELMKYLAINITDTAASGIYKRMETAEVNKNIPNENAENLRE